MNIFILDEDPVVSAKYHVKTHITKMPLETAQMLSTTIRILDVPYDTNKIYKVSHQNHPCNIWTRASYSNFLKLCDIGFALCDEFKFRRNKPHGSERIIAYVYSLRFKVLEKLSDVGSTPYPQAMSEQYRKENAVDAYRSYYVGEKQHLFDWECREVPEWIKI